MKERLGILIHWLSFLALVILMGDSIYAIMDGRNDLAGIVEIVIQVFFFLDSYDDIGATLFVWIAIAGWPIKWFLTGNKALFPWSKG